MSAPSQEESAFSLVDIYVLERQLEQIKALRLNERFDGKLQHFRQTLYPDGRRLPCNFSYPVPVYADLRDIEHLEAQLRQGNFEDFIVQCCSICEAYLAVEAGAQPYWKVMGQNTWIFDVPGIENVATVVSLRSRLNFPGRSSKLEEALEVGTICAVLRVIIQRQPSWQELIMLMRVAGAETVAHVAAYATLSPWFNPLIEAMPRAASSLLLSHVCDRLAKASTLYTGAGCREMILTLVSCGAALETSTADHPVLSRMIMRHLGLDETPWWLDEEVPADDGQTTALCKLGYTGWRPAQMRELLLKSCCTIDLRSPQAASKVPHIPQLKCLAAQQLRTDQVWELPRLIQDVALRHIAVEAYHDEASDLSSDEAD